LRAHFGVFVAQLSEFVEYADVDCIRFARCRQLFGIVLSASLFAQEAPLLEPPNHAALLNEQRRRLGERIGSGQTFALPLQCVGLVQKLGIGTGRGRADQVGERGERLQSTVVQLGVRAHE
jgi:hypothetical protein